MTLVVSATAQSEILAAAFVATTRPSIFQTLYAGLLDAGDAELTQTEYARQPVTFEPVAGEAVANDANISFPEAVTPWSNVTKWALFTNLTGGTALLTDNITDASAVATTVSIVAGQVITLGRGNLRLEL